MQLIDHLRRSAELLLPLKNGQLDTRHVEFVEAFEPDGRQTPIRRVLNLPAAPPARALADAESLLRADGFDCGVGPDYGKGTLDGRLEANYSGGEGWLAWLPREPQPLRLALLAHIEVPKNGPALLYLSRDLPTWAAEFEHGLSGRLSTTIGPGPAVMPGDLLIGPGEPIPGPFSGNLMDFSGCATEADVGNLLSGDLPLGRWAFGFPAEDDPEHRGGVRYGPDLFMSRYRTGARMIYNGALICAPQNSGKTRLIMRWALAANRAGMNVLLVDVKGNLYDQLAHKLVGRKRLFSTDPSSDAGEGVNFLSGLDDATPEGRMRIRQLVEAILPKEGWEAGEQAYFHQNHTNWLTGLIHIVLLYRRYYPQHFVDAEADLSVVYSIASSEQELYRMIDVTTDREGRLSTEKRIEPGVEYWKNEISLLISPKRGGQRTADYSYRALTQSICNALRPFSRYGTLFRKTSKGRVNRPNPPREFFSFEELKDHSEPLTIFLAAREQDVDDATTVVSMVVKRLQHILFDRMQEREDKGAILLLLDETRRIRSFAPDEYVTFARQARAGCVIVYQSLDQIGDEKKIRVILENIGTQIYLGSVVGETARLLNGMLPRRRRPVFSSVTAVSESRRAETSLSTQVGYEMVDFLSSIELFRLPAGKYPALVYLNSQPRQFPILVDMDEDLKTVY